MRELILINPTHSNPILSLILHCSFKNSLTLPLLTIAGLTPDSYRVTFHHQRSFWSREHFRPGALVGITTITGNAAQAYRLADRFRKAGARVVLGGPHASALPEEALRHADSVVIGEAEAVWPEVLADFEQNTLKAKYQRPPLEDFFSPVYPYFARLDPAILRNSGLFISRGCEYDCEFCACYHGKPRYAKIDQIVALVERLKNSDRNFIERRRPILFHDDNFFTNRAFAQKLFQRLKNLKVAWAANAPLWVAFDDDLLTLARESGCYHLFIGIESIHPADLPKTSAGGMRSSQDILKALRRIRKKGIRVTGAFIIGLDSYRHRDYFALAWFILRARFWITAITILTPFPGSALFERLKKEGRLLTTDWRRYDLLWSVVFRPKHMSRFSVWFWFLLIRSFTILIAPYFLLIAGCGLIAFNLLYAAGYFLSQRLLYGQ